MKYTDNTNQAINELQQRASLFLRFMTDEIISISTPITPKKTGRMRMDVLKQVLGLNGKIVWGKDYAVYQETKKFKNYTTPGTSYKFAETGATGGVKKTSEVARKAGLL